MTILTAEVFLQERRGALLMASRVLEAYRKHKWPEDVLRRKEGDVLWALNAAWGAQEYLAYCKDHNYKSDNRWLGRDK